MTVTNPWVKASERIPVVGIYNATYNGDHVVYQCHDGGHRIIFYDSRIEDVPKLYLIKWLDETIIHQMEETITRQKEALEKIALGVHGEDETIFSKYAVEIAKTALKQP